MGKLIPIIGVLGLFAVGAGAATLNQSSADDCEMVIVKQGGELVELVVCDDGSSFKLAHGATLANSAE